MPIASKDTRERAVAAYRSKKYTQAQVARMFGIHYKTLQNWLRCDERGEEQLPKTRGHNRPVLTDEHRDTIKNMVLANPSITIASIIEKLGTGSKSAIHRALVKLGFTYKKKRYEPVSRNGKI